jgi:hypothetical protein
MREELPHHAGFGDQRLSALRQADEVDAGREVVPVGQRHHVLASAK